MSLIVSPQVPAAASDPFAVLKPGIVVTDDDRRTLDSGDVLLKILPAKDHELAVLAAGSLNATSAQLAAKINDIADLKRSASVPEIARFSNPPVLSDLDALTLDKVDMHAVKSCHPGDCALKLSEDEIDDLQRVIAASGDAGQAAAVNREFRRIMLNRVKGYLAHGLSAIPAYATGHHQVDLVTAFSTLLQGAGFIQSDRPELGQYLARYPAAPPPDKRTTSFLYWSKEKFAWKPIISVTQVTILEPRQSPDAPELLIASKEVFSTRYTSGALVLTLLLHGTDGRRYLVYLNRTWVDGLHAFWRPFVDHRVKREAVGVFDAARARIEGRTRARANR